MSEKPYVYLIAARGNGKTIDREKLKEFINSFYGLSNYQCELLNTIPFEKQFATFKKHHGKDLVDAQIYAFQELCRQKEAGKKTTSLKHLATNMFAEAIEQAKALDARPQRTTFACDYFSFCDDEPDPVCFTPEQLYTKFKHDNPYVKLDGYEWNHDDPYWLSLSTTNCYPRKIIAMYDPKTDSFEVKRAKSKEPKENIVFTYEQLYVLFKQHYPNLSIDDYRPGEQPNSIRLWVTHRVPRVRLAIYNPITGMFIIK